MGADTGLHRCVLAGALALAAVAAGPTRAEPLGWLDQQMGQLVSPGALAAAHAHLDAVSDCAGCHGPLVGTPDADCLACHEEVGARREASAGAHGSFEGACASCHPDHRGHDADLLGLDREAFNHAQALFELRGAHADVECEDCHLRVHPETGRERFQTLGIAHETCLDCHEDVHAGSMEGRECVECHTESAWSDLRRAPEPEGAGFDHDRDTDFALAGRHAGVACGGCHTAERRERERAEELPPGTGAPRECATCHEDVHETALGSDCGACHTPDGWTGDALRFDHDATDLPLDAVHAEIDCTACHADLRFAAAGSECATCHRDAAELLAGTFGGRQADPDPHHGEVDCRGCHPADADETGLLAYRNSCLECHPAEYGRLLITRRRRLDDGIVRAEARLRTLELARERGEGDASVAEAAALLDRIARSGSHHAELAEAILRSVLDEPAFIPPSSGNP